MKKRKLLINHTNHPSTVWDDKQRKGWEIIDLPFPNIPPQISISGVNEIAKEHATTIREIVDGGDDVHILLQGEFSYCYTLKEMLRDLKVKWVIPTTERKTYVEDGRKVSQFKFVRWRYLNQ